MNRDALRTIEPGFATFQNANWLWVSSFARCVDCYVIAVGNVEIAICINRKTDGRSNPRVLAHNRPTWRDVAVCTNRVFRDRGRFSGVLTVEGRYWIGLAQAGLDESMHPQVAARLWRALSSLSSGRRMHDCAQRALALSQTGGDEKGRLTRSQVLR